MYFWQAMRLTIIAGCIVKRNVWKNHTVEWVDDARAILLCDNQSGRRTFYVPSPRDIEMNDWEIVS